MVIETELPAVEAILGEWQTTIGGDYRGYRNHVYRMLHFCFALQPCQEAERVKLIIAGCFHDLGIWSHHTFDYLAPSIALAREYLHQNGLDHWRTEIELMIEQHHKLRRYPDPRYPLVEVFRQGDLVDFSLGLITCGIPRSDIQQVQQRFPNAGFHKRLVQLTVGWFPGHPTNPLPVLKW